MKEYKWSLRKSSRKEICPACGQKRFVPYVLTNDGTTLAGEEFGRCDREQSCGYHRYPNGEVYATQPIKVEQKPRLFYDDKNLHLSIDSNLFQYAVRLIGFSDALIAWDDYRVGCIDGRVIWWQCDINGVVRTGKVMSYKSNGHRNKDDQYGVTWAHKYPKIKELFKGEELQQCLFGEHLLRRYPKKVVVLVESEKTAVIMSRIFRQYLWLATGGSQGIKSEDRIAVLGGRKVALFPDNGQYYSWLRVAEKHGWSIWGGLEKKAPFEGCDILDVVEHLFL